MKCKVKEGCSLQKEGWIYNAGYVLDITEEEYESNKDSVELLEDTDEENLKD